MQKDLDPLQRFIQEEEEQRTTEEAEQKAAAARSKAPGQGEDGGEAGRKPGARTAAIAAWDAKTEDAKGIASSASSDGGGGGSVRRVGYSAEEETRWRRSMNVIDTVLQQ